MGPGLTIDLLESTADIKGSLLVDVHHEQVAVQVDHPAEQGEAGSLR